MKLKNNFLLSTLAAALTLSFFHCGRCHYNTKTYSHNQNRTHPVHKAFEFMAKRASQLSDGELKIRIYPDAQLGSQRESLELVQKGAIALANPMRLNLKRLVNLMEFT